MTTELFSMPQRLFDKFLSKPSYKISKDLVLIHNGLTWIIKNVAICG